MKYTSRAVWYTDEDVKDPYRNQWKNRIRRKGDGGKNRTTMNKLKQIKTNPVTTAFFIPKTMEGRLTQMVQLKEDSIEDKMDWRVKILEKPGSPLVNQFITTFPMDVTEGMIAYVIVMVVIAD